MNGYQSESEDNSPKPRQICCLVEDKERCKRSAGNACYSKRIQKTVAQKKLKLEAAESVRMAILCLLNDVTCLQVCCDLLIQFFLRLARSYLYL